MICVKSLPYTHVLGYSEVLERDLEEEFSRREYLMDASEDLAAREPSFFSGLKHVVLAIFIYVNSKSTESGSIAQTLER